MTTILITGITLDVIGTVSIAHTVLRVHDRVRREHTIDLRVMKEMRRERIIGIVGIALVVVGYIFQVIGLAA